jgi:hypothetical protein
MKLSFLAATLLILMKNIANAGFFNSLFGSEESVIEVKVETTKATSIKFNYELINRFN